MRKYEKFKIENKSCENESNYNFDNNNSHNIDIQKENEIKFDILLDGILLDTIIRGET